MNVLAEMERHPDEPWKVRDRMLQRNGLVLEGQFMGGLEGGRAEPALLGARRHRAVRTDHGCDGSTR